MLEVRYTSELRVEHNNGRVGVILNGKGISISSFDSNGVAAPIPPEVWDEVKDYITEMAYYAVCMNTVDVERREVDGVLTSPVYVDVKAGSEA